MRCILHESRRWVQAIFVFTLVTTGIFSVSSPFTFTTVEAQEETAARYYEDDLDRIVNAVDELVLNVHVVPHTHDDVGWLKTVDQYYYGTNNTIQHANVNMILTSVMKALEEDHRRKFTYVEMKFFSMWYEEQTEQMRRLVKTLVKRGQLNFVNGGWCMHDEATTHFMGMIDQTTLGHDFLKQTFDYIPSIGWQLDPFGHSATQASLMSSEMGFNALYFGRIDWQDLQIRQEQKRCEGVWSSSPSLGTSVFWGLTGSYEGNYGAYDGFCFDVLCADPPLVANKQSSEYNMHERVSKFISKMVQQGKRTQGNNIMLTMGSDFQFENAAENFRNLDLMISGVKHFLEENNNNENNGLDLDLDRFQGGINIFYSSPELYTKAKYREKLDWEVKVDDFFPYSDCKHCFWTGYFVSRASLKRFERFGSSFLHASRHLEVKDKRGERSNRKESDLYDLDDAMGVLQHHDGVSGTSKQHVAYDYAKRVYSGIQRASSYIGSILSEAFGGGIEFNSCHALNVSVCEITQKATQKVGTDVYVAAYNAMGIRRTEVVALPVDLDATYEVTNLATSENVDCALIPFVGPKNNEDQTASGSFKLYFEAKNLPPLGAVLFRIRIVDEKSSAISPSKQLERVGSSQKGDITVNNGIISVSFDRSTYSLKSVRSHDEEIPMSVNWGFYHSFVKSGSTTTISAQPQGGDSMAGAGQCLAGYFDWEGDERKWLQDTSESMQNSGAYIFRPSTPSESLTVLFPHTSRKRMYQSALVTEVHTELSTWVKQVVRLFRNTPYFEIEYTVGPVPAANGGKEVIMRYSTNIDNKGTFFTDSNGRDFLKRKLSHRDTWELDEYEPIAGNFYPVNTAIYIEDAKRSLAVLTDRSQGGSSLMEGSIEIMVQRRTKADDFRGVDEPLDETDKGINPYPPYGDRKRLGKGVIMNGSSRIVFGAGEAGAKLSRSNMDKVFSPVHLFFGTAATTNELNFVSKSFSLMKDGTALPENVMLITFTRLHGSKNTFLLRLGHQYAIGEDNILSNTALVSLSDLFPDYYIMRVSEKTLSGNQSKKIWNENKMKWNQESNDSNEALNDDNDFLDSFVISLKPMQIRTFEVHVRSGGEDVTESKDSMVESLS